MVVLWFRNMLFLEVLIITMIWRKLSLCKRWERLGELENIIHIENIVGNKDLEDKKIKEGEHNTNYIHSLVNV